MILTHIDYSWMTLDSDEFYDGVSGGDHLIDAYTKVLVNFYIRLKR